MCTCLLLHNENGISKKIKHQVVLDLSTLNKFWRSRNQDGFSRPVTYSPTVVTVIGPLYKK